MIDVAALFDRHWKNEPYPLYAQLRSDNPVARLHDTPYYFVSRLPRNETFDFMHVCARNVPSWAICTLLGMPLSMQSQLGQWAQQLIKLMLGNTSDAVFVKSAEAGPALQIYLSEFLKEAEKNPGDNLTGDLVMLVRAGDLPRTTALGMLLQLVIGGADTTASWIANSLLLLMRKPEHQLAVNQSDTLTALLEETLRLETPSQGNYRIAREAVTIGDIRLPEASILVLLWGAANRDATIFSTPNDFDLQRQGPQHLGFGRGIHACIGANLARLETRALYTALAPLLPCISPEGDIERPDWTESLFSRQLESLQVCLRD